MSFLNDEKYESNGHANMPDQNNAKVELNNVSNSKRVGYLEWEDYFMAVAFLSAQRSKDPVTQVGACIVDGNKKVVGIGYNGMPTGCSDDILPWTKSADSMMDRKHAYVCHAELNAVLNKNSADVKGCAIYVALFPCNECAKVIIQSGIKEVVYYSNKYSDKITTKAAQRMLDLAGVKYSSKFILRRLVKQEMKKEARKHHSPKQKQIVIDFESINAT